MTPERCAIAPPISLVFEFFGSAPNLVNSHWTRNSPTGGSSGKTK